MTPQSCIPVVLSDNWFLPFDRTTNWTGIALHVPENGVPVLPQLLRSFLPEQIAAIQSAVIDSHQVHFFSIDTVVETFLRELEKILDSDRQGN